MIRHLRVLSLHRYGSHIDIPLLALDAPISLDPAVFSLSCRSAAPQYSGHFMIYPVLVTILTIVTPLQQLCTTSLTQCPVFVFTDLLTTPHSSFTAYYLTNSRSSRNSRPLHYRNNHYHIHDVDDYHLAKAGLDHHTLHNINTF